MKSYRITIDVDLDSRQDLLILISQIQDLVEAKVSDDGGYGIYDEEIEDEE
jgi:hypothetical protein